MPTAKEVVEALPKRIKDRGSIGNTRRDRSLVRW